MQFAGVFFAFGAVMVFLVVPGVLIAGRWRTLEPGARRGIAAIYLIVLAGAGLLYWMIERWSSHGPLD